MSHTLGLWEFVELVARGNTEMAELEAMAEELLEAKCHAAQAAEIPLATKHTPGPWYVIKGAYNSIRISDRPEDKRLAGIAQITEWAKSEVREANARLIAAAPELLDALQLVLEELKQRVAETGVERHIAEIKKAENAILKAGGWV